MSENVDLQAQPQTPQPDLQPLQALVGTWKLSEDVQGQVVFEWMEGGFFLIQHVDLVHAGRKHKGIEIIGHELVYGATEPGKDIKSRYYDTLGNTLDYVYELEGGTLTIWGGEKGSPAFFRGQFSDDGNLLAGAWQWPGGGYKATMTRVK